MGLGEAVASAVGEAVRPVQVDAAHGGGPVPGRRGLVGSLVLGDEGLAMAAFGNLYMMDYELMGSSARDAIVKETAKAGMTAFLPPLVPFGSKQWPALITPGPGPATLLQLP